MWIMAGRAVFSDWRVFKGKRAFLFGMAVEAELVYRRFLQEKDVCRVMRVMAIRTFDLPLPEGMS